MSEARRPRHTPDTLAPVIRRSRFAIALESFARGFWPIASLMAVVWAALAFGLADALPRAALIAALGLAALCAVLLLWRGLRALRWPTADQARARIDEDLPGRPLAALRDRPAIGYDDPGAAAVWMAHRARMERIAALARPVRADLRLARFDPLALRLMAIVALIAAAIFARGDGVAGVTAALAPGPAPAVASGPSFEGWAEPPAYTGRPTLYLPEVSSDRPVAIPQGARITLRAYGSGERFDLGESVTETGDARFAEVAPGIAESRMEVARTGSVILRDLGAPLGEWSFLMERDQPPEIAMSEPVGRAAGGEAQISFDASDDHGVVSGSARIELDLAAVDRRHGLAVEPVARAPIEIDLPMPMSGAAQEVADTLVEDFSGHPWVGLPVRVTLTAVDALDQVGTGVGETAPLPGRRFYDPIAAALVEQRRDLLWSPENARRVTQVLRAITHRPDEIWTNERAYLVTRIAIRRLAAAEAEPAPVVEEVAEALWRAALLIEDGSLGDAAERLARARERLSEALRNDASDEEIAELMEELRQATRAYMEQLAREAIERGETQSADSQQGGQEMTQDQIQQLMDRIQELSEQGRRAEAEQLLEMLQQLLENMEMRLAQGGSGDGGPGGEAMQGLSDALREQQGLADESFEQLQREFRQGRQGQGGQGSGQTAPGGDPQGEGSAGQTLADRQDALRQLMEEMQGNLPGEAGEGVRDALREAERNMGEAGEGLRRGDTAGALDRQSEVLENLREGLRQMGEDLRRAEQGQSGEQEIDQGQAQADGENDPLGRPLGGRGGIGSNQSMVPEADVQARARAILDEIRRRSGEQARPQVELDYLRRLLDRF